MRGSRMPCWPYAYCTSPEQSNPLSAVPPHTYGIPSDSSAVCTTSLALPEIVAGGNGGGKSGRAAPPPPPLPPALLPNPNHTPNVPPPPFLAAVRLVPDPLGSCISHGKHTSPSPA